MTHSYAGLIFNIKKSISSAKDPVKVLEDAFQGKTVLVVSAGPSAKDWRDVYKDLENENPVVVCIKQAHDLVGDMCDIHFLNNWNLKKYSYNSSCLSIMTNDNFACSFGKYDVDFFINRDISKHGLCSERHFENFELSKTGVSRPVGPGIMHETVLYTMLHMGFKKIVTIGWDIADDSGLNSHFNDDNQKIDLSCFEGFVERFKRYIGGGRLKTALIVSKSLVMKPFNMKKFELGESINRASMKTGEAELVSSSIPETIRWLSLKGVNVEIRGSSKWTNH